MAGITRQAIYAIEANLYLPTTAVALRLAGALDCRVEDLFSLVFTGEVIEVTCSALCRQARLIRHACGSRWRESASGSSSGRWRRLAGC